MISNLDCFPCIIRHSLDASREITDDKELQREVMNRVMGLLPDLPPHITPVRLAAEAHELIRELLGVDDPYAEKKKKYNNLALNLLPQMKRLLDRAHDKFEAAVRIAIAGNIIDFGALCEQDINMEKTLEQSLSNPFSINDFFSFRNEVRSAGKIIYVGDNAGEIVFDRLLIEEIQRISSAHITFVVRGRPILNDATLEDARLVGLTEMVEVIDSKGDAPGCELDRAPEVRNLFESADLIISKGQGNYEALSLEPYPIYFLLRVKCKVIARDIGGEKGTCVIKSHEYK